MKRSRLRNAICTIGALGGILIGMLSVPDEVKAANHGTTIYLNDMKGVYGYWARGYYYLEKDHYTYTYMYINGSFAAMGKEKGCFMVTADTYAIAYGSTPCIVTAGVSYGVK